MGWKVLTVPYPGLREKIFERFADIYIKAGCPPDNALFSRADFSGEPTLTYLISPEASDWLGRISGGKWEDDPDAPTVHSWSLLVGDVALNSHLGVKLKAKHGT